MDTSVRVLLVDDEPGIRHVLGALIRDFGYDVHTAESAREALEAFTANPFPIVVTDIRMPGMDGLELLRHVRSERPELRVLVLLARVRQPEALRELLARQPPEAFSERWAFLPGVLRWQQPVDTQHIGNAKSSVTHGKHSEAETTILLINSPV